MKIIIRTLTVVLAGTLSTTAAAQVDAPRAVVSNTTGFYAGLFLNGSAVKVEDSDVIESGAGGSLHLGYGVNQNVSFFVRANAAQIESEDVNGESYTMAHFDLGARVSIGSPASQLRPFVQGGVSGRAFSLDMDRHGELQARGPGFTAGAGLEVFVAPEMALEAGLSYSFGRFKEGRLGHGEWVGFGDAAFSATSARFDLGVSWHP